MLPERLSTDLTSLADQQDRLALVIEFAVNPDGSIASSDIFAANVRNRAKLAYNSVAAWLKGAAPAPAALAACPGMDEQIRIQDEVAQRLKNLRFQHGALNFETLEASPVFVDGKLSDLRVEEKSRAKELIEDFMIAANGISAAFLKNKRLPSLRRVVREPERWARIVQVAADVHETLPAQPDAAALEAFLAKRRAADPLRFPDLSLTIVKLMGRGEYVVEAPDEPALGHFGLAVMDYAHTTAPNRRFPDLITHRLIKAALAGQAEPYSLDELNALAKHCTEMEDLAAKVERQVRKSAAALLFESKLGQQFDALVTGASEKGTWVRTIAPPVEGKIQHGAAGLDVGQRVRVRLERVDVERGFIDFTALGKIGG
jgi:exoribonuclease-2